MQVEVEARKLTIEELESALDELCRSPQDFGVLRLIARRPQVGLREVLDEGRLDLVEGLVGDNWRVRRSSTMSDGSADPDMQIKVMNARVIALLAQDIWRWPLAGDQLFVDLDLSAANLPPGTRLAIGSAVIEVTPAPHRGCRKFADCFGADAMRFVNSPAGRTLNLRGINARVVQPGVIRGGDVVRKTSLQAHHLEVPSAIARWSY